MITNILLTEGGHNKGYLSKEIPLAVTPTFATANVAVRRDVLAEVGGFDTRCQTGEDMDLGLRVAQSSWQTYFEPRALVWHKHRVTLWGLLKQWFFYSLSHPYVLKKNGPIGVQVYWLNWKRTQWRGLQLQKFFGMNLPVHFILYLTSFHFFHLFGALALWAHGMSLSWLEYGGWGGFIFYGVRVFSSRYSNEYSWRERMAFILIRYLLNWVYVFGGIVGGLKCGVLYVEATRES